MSLSANKMKILSLYKLLLRESQKFSAYNYRSYALRRIRDTFRDSKSLVDSSQIAESIKFAEHNLDTIRRQVIVQNLYGTDKLVIEK